MFILVEVAEGPKNDAINSNNTYIQRKQNSQEQLSSLAPGLGPSQVCLLLLLSTLFTLCNLYTCTFLLNPQVQPGQRLYVLPAKPTHIKRFASLRLTHVNNKVNGRQQLMHKLGRSRGGVQASSSKMRMPMGKELRPQFS